MPIPKPEYLCAVCEDTGYQKVTVGKIASGVTVHVESDIPCRNCARKYREAVRQIEANAARIREDMRTGRLFGLNRSN